MNRQPHRLSWRERVHCLDLIRTDLFTAAVAAETIGLLSRLPPVGILPHKIIPPTRISSLRRPRGGSAAAQIVVGFSEPVLSVVPPLPIVVVIARVFDRGDEIKNEEDEND